MRGLTSVLHLDALADAFFISFFFIFFFFVISDEHVDFPFEEKNQASLQRIGGFAAHSITSNEMERQHSCCSS